MRKKEKKSNYIKKNEMNLESENYVGTSDKYIMEIARLMNQLYMKL